MKKFLIFILVLAVLIGGAGLYGWGLYQESGNSPLKTEEETIEIVVEPNDTFSRLFTRLDREEKVRNLLFTRIYFKNNPIETKLKPGTFLVNAKGSLEEIIQELNEGQDIYEVKVTIPEGMTIEGMGDIFEEAGLFSKRSFIDAVNNYITPSWLSNVDQRRYTLEGFLAPATYTLKKEQTPGYVVDQMYKAFVNRMYGIIEDKGLDLPTEEWNRVLTVASMIERETATVEEMPRISGVMYNRLRENMRLQIDATVIYALGLTSKDKVTLDDLEVSSPYNTYKIKELPVGPISNPGAAAILAALEPEVHDYIYYILDPAQGQHFFTRSYDEFLQKKREFQG